ncbi:uncharacterized protein M8220_017498 [Acridotheres tristis]
MERRLSLEQRTERLVRRRPSGRPPSLDAAMPPPGHKGTPSGHRDPPGMPTWATPTHGGANKAVCHDPLLMQSGGRDGSFDLKGANRQNAGDKISLFNNRKSV